MNGAIDTSAAEERRIGCVDDSISGFFCDVGGAMEGDGFAVGEEEAHGNVQRSLNDGGRC